MISKKKIVAKALAGVMVLNMGVLPVTNTQAATEHWNDASAAWNVYKADWVAISANYENVSLTPGINETEVNFAWYSKTQEVPKVKFADNKDMQNAAEFSGTQENIDVAVAGYYSNKVTVTGLKEETDYYYQVFQNGIWSETKTYATGSFENYSILYVGDPQIGASTGQTSADGEAMNEKLTGAGNLAARNDSFNWNETLTGATAQHNVSFVISAGDQVNTATREEEYAGYLSASALASLPVATTIGNHDSTSPQYTYHFNNPNAFDKNSATDTDYVTGATAAGTDYYYTYGNVLFIVIDTNNYNCATHKNVIQKAVKESPDCKWRVVTFHQDIYGSGYDHSDSDGIVLRTQLTPIFDEFDIDIVLQGHDHTYSRSYQLTGDGKEHQTYSSSPVKASTPLDDPAKVEYLKENACYNIVSEDGNTVVNPEGTVYFEANSATGSKFYELIPVQQDYIAKRSQTWTPSYSVIDVSENAITVTTFDASTGAKLAGSDSYTIVKEADKTTLKNAISDAQEKMADKTVKYTGESFTALNSAVIKAQDVLDNKKATEEEISEAAGAISKAQAGLVIEKKSDDNKTIIQVITTPKAQAVKSAKATNKKVKLTWKKNAKATGYEIKVATNKKVTKNVKKVIISKASTTSKTITGLKKSKTYYVKMRAYVIVNGKKYYGSFGTVKKVTVKK